MKSPSIVTLLTDYGTRDYYVGALKGAILSIAPHAQLVDITHEIEPQNIRQASFVLRYAMETFPENTIHIAIVDPGVGSSRKLLLGRYAGQFVVAPDNGLLTWIEHDMVREGLWSIENDQLFRSPISSTFHGRDILGPIAGHLASGISPQEMGPEVFSLVLLPIEFRAKVAAHELRGSIIHVDEFGNLVSNVHRDQLAASTAPRVLVNGEVIGQLDGAFHHAPPGVAVAYLGSAGFLEIGLNCGRAVDRYGRSASVHVKL